MRLQPYVLAVAVFVPCVAAAQTSTADGVRAIARMDYPTAARILQPLAEDGPESDPLAQFFMAMLYDTGRGVARNNIRACALYLRAARPGNPLMAQALTLAAVIHHDHPVMRRLCGEGAEGIWRDPPAASFTLGADHWVHIDQTGLTIGYHGEQKKPAMSWGGVGWVFLPMRLTPMDVSIPTTTRRYFLEFFMWMPHSVSNQPAWTLMWDAYEIVRLEARPVPGGGPIATFTGAQPPTVSRLEETARFVVNANGEVERIVSGENPRSTVIPFGEPR